MFVKSRSSEQSGHKQVISVLEVMAQEHQDEGGNEVDNRPLITIGQARTLLRAKAGHPR